MRLRVEDDGSTVVEAGEPNVRACLKSDSDAFLEFYLERVLAFGRD